MRKMRIKELEEMVRLNAGINVSGLAMSKAKEVYGEGFKRIAYTAGANGMSGYLLQGEETGKDYIYIGRDVNLFSY